ncbi:MAG TPA: FlgD immunoglobulin-like domain containing protein [Candidatus Eisenbacteria bacterium]|nr:FlgD immunoglobulin-like domain containing protein [Candidatus Eisenbacteria bacterium]
MALCAPARPCFPVSLALSLLCLTVAAAPATVTKRAGPLRSPVIIDNDDRMDVNNLDMFVTNHGSIAFDWLTANPGLIYPRGTTGTVVFAAGLWVGAKVNGSTRVAVSEYAYEFGPGPMAGGTYLPDQPSYRNFRIERGGAGYDEYLQEAVPQGAPMDVNGNPLLLGDALNWSVFNDANPDGHMVAGTDPLGVEVQQSVFAFNRAGPLGSVIFVKWRLANRGANLLQEAYVGTWVDPDVGEYTDDLVGCDTTRALGYAYNSTNQDAIYGSTPPAVGFHLLQGPVAQGDTLGMTAFLKHTNGTDPTSAEEMYQNMAGRNADGSPFHVCNDPLQPVTTFQMSGLDPGSASLCPGNWLDTSPADRRFLLSSGPFTMAPGDTQVVLFAIEVGRGNDRIASIEDLKQVASAVSAVIGLILDPTTAVQASLVESHVDAATVRLVWRVSEPAGTVVAVERRTVATDWHPIAEITLLSDRILRIEDTQVTPGARYAYRLAIGTGGSRDYSSESWVDVPAAATTPTSIRLLPGRPNPSSVSFRIGHYAPRPGTYRITVLDVQGRVVRVLEEREMQTGWHDGTWDGRDGSGAEVGSGVYVLRIEGAGETAVQKLVLMR